MMARIYEAKCTREGDWWSVAVTDQLEGGEPLLFTQARRLRQVDAMVIDAVTTLLEVPESEVVVVKIPELNNALNAQLEARRRARSVARAAASDAARADVDIARALVNSGLTIRDAGDILEISFQRVAQLVGNSE